MSVIKTFQRVASGELTVEEGAKLLMSEDARTIDALKTDLTSERAAHAATKEELAHQVYLLKLANDNTAIYDLRRKAELRADVAEAESAGRLKVLNEKAEALRLEWQRAERAEAQLAQVTKEREARRGNIERIESTVYHPAGNHGRGEVTYLGDTWVRQAERDAALARAEKAEKLAEDRLAAIQQDDRDYRAALARERVLRNAIEKYQDAYNNRDDGHKDDFSHDAWRRWTIVQRHLALMDLGDPSEAAAQWERERQDNFDIALASQVTVAVNQRLDRVRREAVEECARVAGGYLAEDKWVPSSRFELPPLIAAAIRALAAPVDTHTAKVENQQPRSTKLQAKCALCGASPALGYATADGKRLCHDDSRSCYHLWTVYKKRPSASSGKEGDGE